VTQAFFWMAGYDGCGYYRMQLPAENLRRQQFWQTDADVILSSGWAENDVIVGQRIYMNEEGASPVLNFIKICQDPATIAVFEMDDNLMATPESNPAFEVFSDEAVQQNLKACASMADLVTVSTEPLRDVMLAYNPNVEVVPNFIDAEMLRVERLRLKLPTIGWAGSSTHSDDFAVLGDAIGEAMLMQPKSLACIMGGEKSYDMGIPKNRLKRFRWVSNPRQVSRFTREFDIGIAPLAKNQFNESKSHIKVLEYAALGIPTVASNVTAYNEMVIDGVTGFLVDTPKEWRDALLTLLNDEELRERMGRAARKHASQFTIQRNVHLWSEALSC
jgi:glycosyltransferase involved in cell wall biosynthesis